MQSSFVKADSGGGGTTAAGFVGFSTTASAAGLTLGGDLVLGLGFALAFALAPAAESPFCLPPLATEAETS